MGCLTFSTAYTRLAATGNIYSRILYYFLLLISQLYYELEYIAQTGDPLVEIELAVGDGSSSATASDAATGVDATEAAAAVAETDAINIGQTGDSSTGCVPSRSKKTLGKILFYYRQR